MPSSTLLPAYAVNDAPPTDVLSLGTAGRRCREARAAGKCAPPLLCDSPRDPEGPRLEWSVTAELIELPVNEHERLLCDLVRFVRIARIRQRPPVHAGLQLRDKLAE